MDIYIKWLTPSASIMNAFNLRVKIPRIYWYFCYNILTIKSGAEITATQFRSRDDIYEVIYTKREAFKLFKIAKLDANDFYLEEKGGK